MPPALVDLSIALALGLLVGLQREWADKGVAGLRTFGLVSTLGALCALLSEPFGPWTFAVGLLGVLALVLIGDAGRLRQGKPVRGVTTEVAALVMYAVGGLVVADQVVAAVVVGAGTAVLLHWKTPLHALVDQLSEDDVRALFRLVLVSLVILPVLPDVDVGPYEVLNPRQIWLMVVLIVGISLAGWLAQRFVGQRAGSALAGFLGGLISSTATTVSHARRAAASPELAPAATAVIVIASSVTFVRVFAEIAVVAPRTLPAVGGPLAAMCGVVTLVSIGTFLALPKVPPPLDPDEDPTDLKGAVLFGLLYAAVLVAVAYASDLFGARALYVVAAISGLTDVDAITLSTAHLIDAGKLGASTGWRVILTGALSNLVFKMGMAGLLGGKALGVRVVAALGVALAGGCALLWLWPG